MMILLIKCSNNWNNSLENNSVGRQLYEFSLRFWEGEKEPSDHQRCPYFYQEES